MTSEDFELEDELGDLMFENSILKANIAALLNCFNRNDTRNRWFINIDDGDNLTRALDGVWRQRLGSEFWSPEHKERLRLRVYRMDSGPLRGGL